MPQYLLYFESCDVPEEIEAEGERLGFFGCVEALVLQGRLFSAWSILSLHSGLRVAKDSNSNDDDFSQIRDVFLSHPRGPALEDKEVEDLSIPVPLVLSLEAWQALARRTQSSQRIVLDIRMDDILSVLAGIGLETESLLAKFQVKNTLSVLLLCFLLILLFLPYSVLGRVRTCTLALLESYQSE